MANSYVYDSYGRTLTVFESAPQPFTYTGRELDSESGLYYYRARYFDPQTGRFISEDPIGFAGRDSNLYRYVINNPINSLDPFGLLQFDIFGNRVDLEVSATFGPFNVSFDLGGFSGSNFSVNAVVPPASTGFGVDIKINPPDDCIAFVSPFLGTGRNLSIGTNLFLDPDTGKLSAQGINLSIGPSVGIPIGVQIPDVFNSER